MTEKIAVFGGSFNPFCSHHQEIIRWLVEEAGWRRVIVLPAAAHALKESMPEFMHRYNMAKLGTNDLCFNGMPSLPYGSTVTVSTLEMDMLRTQAPPVRTYEVLCEIRKGYPDAEIKFAIGPDIPDELDQWENVDKIREEFGFIETPVQSMRATKLRQMIAQGLRAWRQHVPLGVQRYIERNHLYLVDRTICEHEWVPTLVQTYDLPHRERCGRCGLPKPGSESPNLRERPAEAVE